MSYSEVRREIYRQRGALQKGTNRTNKMHESIAANRAEESGGCGERQAPTTRRATLFTKKDGRPNGKYSPLKI